MTSALLAMPLWTKVDSEQDLPETVPPPVQKTPAPQYATPGQSQKATQSPRFPFFLEFREPEDLNKNTAWFSSPGIWSTYILVIVVTSLLIQAFLGCDVASSLLAVNAAHFAVTFYLFHWVKGSPFTEDQGMYNGLTWWEQMDGGRQHTTNRKFMTLIPVALYLIASITSQTLEHSESLFLLNTAMVFVLVVAKLPFLHRVRILGINA